MIDVSQVNLTIFSFRSVWCRYRFVESTNKRKKERTNPEVRRFHPSPRADHYWATHLETLFFGILDSWLSGSSGAPLSSSCLGLAEGHALLYPTPNTAMSARPVVSVFSQEGAAQESTTLPAVFTVPIRPDVVSFVHTNMAKNHRQPYAVSKRAGHQVRQLGKGEGEGEGKGREGTRRGWEILCCVVWCGVVVLQVEQQACIPHCL